MGRIEQIKNRIESEFYVFSEENIVGTLNEYREAHEDIEYLLSRLQIAEEALKKAYNLDGYMFIKEALEKIQKEG